MSLTRGFLGRALGLSDLVGHVFLETAVPAFASGGQTVAWDLPFAERWRSELNSLLVLGMLDAET